MLLEIHTFNLTFLCVVFSHSNIHFTSVVVVVVLIVFSSEHAPSIFPLTYSICLSDSNICWCLCTFILRQMHIDPLFLHCTHLKCFFLFFFPPQLTVNVQACNEGTHCYLCQWPWRTVSEFVLIINCFTTRVLKDNYYLIFLSVKRLVNINPLYTVFNTSVK